MADKKMHPVYFEDEHCAVLYKDIGENAQTFFHALFPRKTFAAAVNRLDTPVSGLTVIAFSAQVQTSLSEAFRNNAVRKEYQAVCEQGTDSALVSAAYYRAEHLIGFHVKKQKAFICSEADRHCARQPDGAVKRRNSKLKKAVLYWQLCGRGERYDFIRILPETGRTHQIRAPMAFLGRPIKGDLKYGAQRSERGGGIRLHCYSLCFTHPVTGAAVTCCAEPVRQDELWKACCCACKSIPQEAL